MDIIKRYFWVLFISMVPLIELRGAIPVGILVSKLPWYECFLICCIGNLIPVPFILIFIRKILEWMKGVKCFSKIALWIEKKAEKNTGRVQKYAVFGLILFVGIPLPGTGAWTGALVAAVTHMKFRHAMLSITLGVLIAAVIMTLVSTGALGIFNFLLPDQYRTAATLFSFR